MNKLLLENSLSPGITPHNAINQPCCECSWQDPQSHKSKLTFLLLTFLLLTIQPLNKQVSLQGHVLGGGLFLELHSGRESILHIYTLLQADYVTKAYWTSTFSFFHFKKMNQCFTSFSPFLFKNIICQSTQLILLLIHAKINSHHNSKPLHRAYNMLSYSESLPGANKIIWHSFAMINLLMSVCFDAQLMGFILRYLFKMELAI